jgi:hypothetical protein
MKKIILLILFTMSFGITKSICQQVTGTKVLIPGNCCVYGYVIYQWHQQTQVDPPTFLCGSVMPMQPQVVMQGYGFWSCVGWSIGENNSFIVDGIGGGGAPVYVIFDFTIEFAGYQCQSFNMPGYVDCWENLAPCSGS